MTSSNGEIETNERHMNNAWLLRKLKRKENRRKKQDRYFCADQVSYILLDSENDPKTMAKNMNNVRLQQNTKTIVPAANYGMYSAFRT